MRILPLILAVSLWIACVWAGDCVTPPVSDRELAIEEFTAATLVVEGEVVSRERLVGTRTWLVDGFRRKYQVPYDRYTLRPLRIYKGPRQEIYRLGSPELFEGSDFRVGKRYLAYARGALEKLYTDACGRTTTLANAGPDLRYLRGDPPQPADLLTRREKWWKEKGDIPETFGTICGSVRGVDGAPIKHARIQLLRPHDGSKYDEAGVTAADGTFRFRFVEPGQYLLRSVYFGGYEVEITGESRPNRRCIRGRRASRRRHPSK